MGGVVVLCLANRAKRPVDLEGSEPSMRASRTFALATGGAATIGEVTSFVLSQVGPTPSLGSRLVVFGESGGVGIAVDFLFGLTTGPPLWSQRWYAMSSSSSGTSIIVTRCPLFTAWVLAASFLSSAPWCPEG